MKQKIFAFFRALRLAISLQFSSWEDTDAEGNPVVCRTPLKVAWEIACDIHMKQIRSSYNPKLSYPIKVIEKSVPVTILKASMDVDWMTMTIDSVRVRDQLTRELMLSAEAFVEFQEHAERPGVIYAELRVVKKT